MARRILKLRVLVAVYMVATTFLMIYFVNRSEPDNVPDVARPSSHSLQLNAVVAMVKRRCPSCAADVDQAFNQMLPTIYVVTPTHTRPEQKAELVRLASVFRLVPKLHWIVVEDAEARSALVTRFLSVLPLPSTHLHVATPQHYKLAEKDPRWSRPRGTLQRNAALSWLRQHVLTDDAVVYFADDDNTYSTELFDEMRDTTGVSVWPVGLVGKLRYEAPICRNGEVVSWLTAWGHDRPFPLDMAGFAVSLKLLRSRPEVQFGLRVMRGYQESSLLQGLVTQQELQPRACNRVLVWHTRTEKADMRNEKHIHRGSEQGTDPDVEV